jgi:molybdopterin synthase sulfur carrier subunit
MNSKSATIRVELPASLRLLAGTGYEVKLTLEGPVTQQTILDALEATYPMLQGTTRDHATKIRRPFIRFFACGQDLSHLSPDAALPEAIVQGAEPFLIIGAIAGG